MLSPREAFAQLSKDGAFVENGNGIHIQWYWHTIASGVRVMARRNLDGNDNAPTYYMEFHESNTQKLDR